MQNEKWLKAAELMVDETAPIGACYQIKVAFNNSEGDYQSLAHRRFYEVYGEEVFFGDYLDSNNKVARSLALLFMYEMGEE